MKQIRTLFLFVVPVLMAVPASAHHSLSMYDRATSKSVSGTVKEFEWTNPHAWIRVVVAKPNGEMEEWHFEGGGVGRLSQRGWSKDMMHEGDKITVEFNPRRDGAPGGLFQSVSTPDGKNWAAGFGPAPRYAQ